MDPGHYPQASPPLQRLPRGQKHPQSPRLSRPRASRGCSRLELRRQAWTGPPSRTAPGGRPAWTTPTRSRGSLPSPAASPGEGREGAAGPGGRRPLCPAVCLLAASWGPFRAPASSANMHGNGSLPPLTRLHPSAAARPPRRRTSPAPPARGCQNPRPAAACPASGRAAPVPPPPLRCGAGGASL